MAKRREHTCGPEPWGTKIKIKREGNEILVFANCLTQGVARSEELTRNGYIDELARFRASERLRSKGKETRGGDSLLMEFVNARKTTQLIEFVRKYGPVSGYPPATQLRVGCDEEDLYFEYRGGRHSGDVVRFQNLDVIKIERRLAATIQFLTSAIWKANPKIVELRSMPQWSEVSFYSSARERDQAVSRFQKWRKEFEPLGQEILDGLTVMENVLAEARTIPEHKRPLSEHWERLGAPLSIWNWKGDSLNAHSLAIDCLCRFFEGLRVRLELNEDGVEWIPVTSTNGVLPILHFMLREQFWAQRRVEVCAKPGCGIAFLVERETDKCCSATCAHALSQSKSYRKGGKQKRAEKRVMQREIHRSSSR